MERPYRFGFSEFTTWPWSYEKDLERYRAHGADAIEICEFKLPHENYSSSLARLRDSGLTPSSVQMNVHSVFVDSMATKPQDPRDRIEAMKRSIDASAPFLPDGTPFIVITGVAPQSNFARAIERTAEALKKLGEHAAQRKMRIAFEPLSPANVHTDTAVWNLEQGLSLVQQVAHPAVGICIDSWNIWQTAGLEELIRQAGRQIFIVQLSDWKTPRSTADRYSLGQGEIPLAALMRAIRQTGYNGPWVVEILSSMHLEGSLWKSDLDALLAQNRDAFEQLWSQSEPARGARGVVQSESGAQPRTVG